MDLVVWFNDWWVVIVNEGDYEDVDGVEGGSCGFIIFSFFGYVCYEFGLFMEYDFICIGYYLESCLENKGIELELVIIGYYGKVDYLFVGVECGNVVVVYKVVVFVKLKLY